MFSNIKKKLMKYFGKSETEAQLLNDSEGNGSYIEPLIIDGYQVGLDLANNEDKTVYYIKKVNKKTSDPKEKLKVKLQIIARRTKSRRIKKKNLKRLVKLFGNY